jgi:uncharacterized protein YbjT (DUF2867 family)
MGSGSGSRILILGASGGTGKHLLEQALAAGHAVTALVRNRAAVATTHPNLRVVEGQATAAADVENAMRDQEAVLSALGPRKKGDPISQVKRVIWLSAGGVGDSKDALTQASFVFGHVILPLFLAKAHANHLRAEEILRASGLEWTVLRPVQLVDGPPTNRATAVFPGDKIGGLKISRSDVASFMLRELGSREHVGRMPILFA